MPCTHPHQEADQSNSELLTKQADEGWEVDLNCKPCAILANHEYADLAESNFLPRAGEA